MRILLDTNVIIHREAGNIVNSDIGKLFNWLDRLHYEKCIHPFSLEELKKHRDPQVVRTMTIKSDAYNILKTLSGEDEQVLQVRSNFDTTENDAIDTSILLECYTSKVDWLITEDRSIHKKASFLGIADKVYTIEAFLEKIIAENPALTQYKVLSVKKEYFGNIDIEDPFFFSFKEDYKEFKEWFRKKCDSEAYVCQSEKGILAFLYIKTETESENYSNLSPTFKPAKRLKIGTFKVSLNGHKLGERFLKIIFDNALKRKVDEIYVTLFDKRPDQELLIKLLEDWGYTFYGTKETQNGIEKVYVRSMRPEFNDQAPQKTYPFISRTSNCFFVPIYPQYHTELLPDSILTTESPMDYIENRPNRNAIKKVYISRSIERNIKSGDIIIFYRTKDQNAGFYTSVATTIGLEDSVIHNIKDGDHFVRLCRKRSIFSDKELIEHWNYKKENRPFIVNFLYLYSFPTPKLTLGELMEYGIIAGAPRGFERISRLAFDKLIEKSNADTSFIID